MNVLVIAAHPDDETLGCGGTLLKHRAQGDRVSWLIATRASSPHWPAAVVRRKAAEIARVARAYGCARVRQLEFPATQLDMAPAAALIARLDEAVRAAKPQVVYLVHHGDVHTDHQAVFRATMAVLKSFYMQRHGVRRVLCYETISSTDAAPQTLAGAFLPTVFHDITPYLARKLRVLSLYRSELQAEPLPRTASAVRALARVRGATIGVRYAEAFALVREVIA